MLTNEHLKLADAAESHIVVKRAMKLLHILCCFLASLNKFDYLNVSNLDSQDENEEPGIQNRSCRLVN